MKIIFRLIVFFIVLLTMAAGGGRSLMATGPEAGTDNLKRIRFHVVTIEENEGKRNTLSEATIEGPPGTDFDINLQASRFKMGARFLTDLLAANSLRVRAKINTRRLYGYSEKKLPLYEEDLQDQALDLGFDEDIILLPFGRNGGANTLKIEITPSITGQPVYSPTGEMRPLEINILKQSPGGSISIQAFKLPHNFEVEATLLENGQKIAGATANCLIEEAQELLLLPNDQAGSEVINNPLAVKFTVSEYTRSRPADEVTINFDTYRIARQQGDKREAVGRNWSGIDRLGSDLKYDLENHYLDSSGRKYELKFNVRLAKGETAK